MPECDLIATGGLRIGPHKNGIDLPMFANSLRQVRNSLRRRRHTVSNEGWINLKTAVGRLEVAAFCDFARSGCVSLARDAAAGATIDL